MANDLVTPHSHIYVETFLQSRPAAANIQYSTYPQRQSIQPSIQLAIHIRTTRQDASTQQADQNLSANAAKTRRRLDRFPSMLAIYPFLCSLSLPVELYVCVHVYVCVFVYVFLPLIKGRSYPYPAYAPYI